MERVRTSISRDSDTLGVSGTRRAFLAATSGAVACSLGGCLGLGQQRANTVTFGTLTIPAVAEVLIARERGFFEERNIQLEIERIPGAPRATPRLASGDLDVATGSVGASLFNSVADGVDITVVADQTQYWPGQPSANRIWVRDAVYEEGMSLADVGEDFTIALHGRGNVDAYIWGRLLQLNDMSWNDVTSTEILYTNMPGAMAAGEIDACSIPDPLGLQLARVADVSQLLYGSAVAPSMQIGVYLFGGPFINNRPDVGRRWLEAYLLGVREYYEMGGFPDEEVASIVSEAFELPKAAIRASVPSLPHKNGRVDRGSVRNQQAYHACRGLVPEPVDVNAVVDQSLLEDALAAVGRLEESAARPSVSTIERWAANAPADYAPVERERRPDGFPGDVVCGDANSQRVAPANGGRR
jgi:ABC-type nitrate/sulfonate/bicarbonate transport system substrate-binding protein